jgi:hypothetical protein
MFITIDIWKTAKERTYIWRHKPNMTVQSIRVWKVVHILGIPVFAWVVKDEVI